MGNARNNYKNVLYFIKEVFESDEFVNTVVYGRTEEGYNVYKNVMYPLVHIIPRPSPYINSNVNRLTFNIGIMEQRDMMDVNIGGRFEGGDNLIDNHNLCFSIFNQFISSIEGKLNEYDIDLINVSPVDFFNFETSNVVDGVEFEITLEVPNTEICFEYGE